ncbi:MAG: restriction endonuclease subunit S [Spirochaetes bacterium]|nr:restriction endonuclease subunit S [Spirochaetota bacterium]
MIQTPLPASWRWVKLGEVCEKAAVVRRKEKSANEKFIYLDIGSIDNQVNRIVSHKEYSWKDAPSRAQQILSHGDILYSTVRTYLKNVAMIEQKQFDGQIGSSGFCVIRGRPEIANQKFLFHYVLTRNFIKDLSELQTGTSYPAVRDRDIFDQNLPLPPLATQLAIVAKIEQLFSELDKGIESIKLAQQQLKTYRQSVLKAAFEGRLTLSESQEEGQNHGLNGLKDFADEDTSSTILKSVKSAQSASSVIQTEGKGLPAGWKWVKSGKIIDVRDGTHDTPKYVTDGKGVPLITSKNLRDGKIDFQKVSYISKTDFKEISKRSAVEAGDILFAMIGTIGNPVVVQPSQLFSIKNVGLFRKNEGVIIPNYFRFFLDSPIFERQLNHRKLLKGTTQKFIPLGSLRDIDVILPPLAEQQAIVAAIESRLSVADQLEATLAQSLAQAELLRQSVLKQAFEGRLV